MLCYVNSLQKSEDPTHKQLRYMTLLLLLSVYVPNFTVHMSIIFLKHGISIFWFGGIYICYNCLPYG